MATQEFKPELTAMPSADVEGHSRLLGEPEEATILAYSERIKMTARSPSWT